MLIVLPKTSKRQKVPPKLASTYLGRFIKAVVVSEPSDLELILDLEGHRVYLEKKHALNRGEVLLLQIIKTQPSLVLEVQERISIQQFRTDVLKLVLPFERPAGNNLSLINWQLLENGNTLPEKTLEQLKSLMAHLPNEETLKSKDGLLKSLKQSGIFLEQHLKTGQEDFIQHDLKAKCLNLIRDLTTSEQDRTSPIYWLNTTAFYEYLQSCAFSTSLQNTLQSPIKGSLPYPIKNHEPRLEAKPSLIKLVQELATQMLSRITSQQLNSLTTNFSSDTCLMLDLTTKLGQSIHSIPVLIEKNNSNKANLDSIMMALDLENLGAIQIKVSKVKGKISLQIWSNNSLTNDLLSLNDALLKKRLKNLHVKLITFYHLGLNLETNSTLSQPSLLDLKV